MHINKMILLIIFISVSIGVVLGWKLRESLWITGDDKVVFPKGEECKRSFQEGVTKFETLKTELGEPNGVDMGVSTGGFLELYYRTMEEKDVGCIYWFDKEGILHKILLRGNPIS